MEENDLTEESRNNKDKDILEIEENFENHFVSLECKDIFDLLEIDEESDFLQLKPDWNDNEKSIKKSDIYENEVIFIPTECKDISILTIDISVRLDNVLRSLNIETLGDLDQKSLSEIKQTKNCGQKTVDELCDVIKKLNGALNLENSAFVSEENRKIVVPKSIENFSVKALPLSVRLANVLDKLNIFTFSDFENRSFAEIKNVEGCGHKTIDELKVFVDKLQDENWIGEITTKYQNHKIFLNEKQNIIILPEVSDVSISSFTLSTRLANVFQNLNIRKLGDLSSFSIQDIKKTKNFGKRTLEELGSFIIRLKKASTPQDLIEVSSGELPEEIDLNSLLGFINVFLEKLPERERDIFVERFGGGTDEKIPTLENLGEKFAVTRERIRQIESKIYKQLVNRIDGNADKALEQVKFTSENVVCPVSIRFLTHLTGNNYDLFVYPPNLYLHILKKLSPEIFVVFENHTLIQPDKNVIKLSQKIKSLLDDEVHFLALKEVFRRLLAQQVFDEFTLSDFFEAIHNTDFILENGDEPDVLLIATDKNRLTMTEMAWQVLKNSENPLLPEEIIEEAKQIFGAEIGFHSERSLANLPSYDSRFYLLDRRTIGLRQHFSLPEEKWAEVADDFYALLSKEQRPVSATEVVNNRLFDWTLQTTPGETTEILREDVRFKDLGRFLFALTDWEIDERESVKDLVVRVLMDTDDALTATEIGERIQKYRSVSVTSMPTILRDHPELKTFDFGSNEERMRLTYYGLKLKDDYRDFFAENETVLKRLVKKLFPISFADLCERLDFDAHGELAEKLWQTLEKIPELRFEHQDSSSETIIKFSYWHLKSRR